MRLFDGENDAAILSQIVAGQIERPSNLATGIPPALEAITMRGLDLDPEKRFATAREMALALQQEVGIVAPSEVGDWVGSIAADRLADRTRTLAQLDSLALPDGASARESPGAPGEPHTRPVSMADPLRRPTPAAGLSLLPTSDAPTTMANELAPPKKRGRALVALLALASAGAAAAWWFRPPPAPVVRMVAPAAEPAPTAALPALVAPPPTTGSSEKVVETAAPEPIRTADAPVGKARGRAPSRPGAASKGVETDRPAPAPVEAAPRDPCKPPYTVDSAGVKHYKVDCVIDGRR
jgi:serine/threonine-protein kinase